MLENETNFSRIFESVFRKGTRNSFIPYIFVHQIFPRFTRVGLIIMKIMLEFLWNFYKSKE